MLKNFMRWLDYKNGNLRNHCVIHSSISGKFLNVGLVEIIKPILGSGGTGLERPLAGTGKTEELVRGGCF